MKNEEYNIFIRGKIVAVCEAVMKEEMGIIAGSRNLISLSYDLFNELDEDFTIFTAIDSQTDHLPVDIERRNWSLEALHSKDKEITEYEIYFRDAVISACKILLKRFAYKD